MTKNTASAQDEPVVFSLSALGSFSLSLPDESILICSLYIRVPPYSGLVDTYRILTNEISESHLLGVTFNYKDIFLSVHLVEVTFNCRYF